MEAEDRSNNRLQCVLNKYERDQSFLDPNPDPIECGSTGRRRKPPFSKLAVWRDAALLCLWVQMKEELNQQIPILINRQIIEPIVLFL